MDAYVAAGIGTEEGGQDSQWTEVCYAMLCYEDAPHAPRPTNAVGLWPCGLWRDKLNFAGSHFFLLISARAAKCFAGGRSDF